MIKPKHRKINLTNRCICGKVMIYRKGWKCPEQLKSQQNKTSLKSGDKGYTEASFIHGGNPADKRQDCSGGQTISVNVGSSRNPLQGKVLATSETSAYGLQATSERSDYKTGSNMETTGDVRLKVSEVVSLENTGTPRSSKSPASNIQNDKFVVKNGYYYLPNDVLWYAHKESYDKGFLAGQKSIKSQTPEQKASDDFFQQEVVDYYKGKAGKEFGKADRLLMDTARNNYKKGFEDGQMSLHSMSRRACYDEGFNRGFKLGVRKRKCQKGNT